MSPSKSVSFCIFLLISLSKTYTDAARFDIRNNCSFTVWIGVIPIGGHRLGPGRTWPIEVAAGTKGGRIWPRTGCLFESTGRGRCETGDCNGLLHCRDYGAPPVTLAEYALNQFNNLDFFDISLVYGFNVPIEFSSDSGNCTRGIMCTEDINGQCPSQLRAPGGCNNPCTVFKTDEYCCNSGNCGPTEYSKFFKQLCPDAYSYPKDDQNSTFTCPGGTNYKVGISCTADINGRCPDPLRAPGGCNNPCTVFKTDEYCCNSGNCGPTEYSKFFKQRCPDAYSYPKDDQTSTFTCPGGTNYKVVFCP
ncbi:hypothetical protein CDL12_13201 [Handroanthus impetiginosus]|uniref:Thaumatin n=1 Tax=Handroanthus impetiginosus TaxID=429701 RepID=A0A2G9H9G6_9LAMI|nr:hypothetical protein CDL12_13201 [Handroanthus impetiginosus]